VGSCAAESGKFLQLRGVFHGLLVGESRNHVHLSTFQNQTQPTIRKTRWWKWVIISTRVSCPSRITSWIRLRNSHSKIIASGMASSNLVVQV
jgi:hypothetical protein